MKKLLKKKQIVLAALVIMLAAAIYINWQFNSNTVGDNSSVVSDNNLGDAEYVGTDKVEISDEESSYFDSARKERASAREELLDELEDIQKDVNNSDEAITSAVNKQVEIMAYSETETNIETLVKAKGFKDCVAIMSEEGINVIVKSDALDNAEILQIQDIVLSQKKVDLDSIKIINIE